MSRNASAKWLFAVGALASLALVVSPVRSAAPQTPSLPDFSSNQTNWTGIGGGEFHAVPGSPLRVTQDPRYRRVPNNTTTGGQPNYRIADISNPNLKQWVKDVMGKDIDEVLAGKDAFSPRSTCSPGGVPGFNVMGGGAMSFLQSPDQVLMIHGGDMQMRRVHLNVPHAANPKHSWYGDSVGHYEGDTLVVDTIGLNDRSFVDAYRTPHTEKMHVIERWRLIDDGERLEVHIAVDDPDTFNQPWQAVRHFQRGSAALEEIICAENNERMFDFEIPLASKLDF